MSEEEQIILPVGFKRVEYLESSGSQYIKLGYIPTNNTGIKAKLRITSLGDSYPMGFYSSASNSFYIPSCGGGSFYGFGTKAESWSYLIDGSVISIATLNYLNDKKVTVTSGSNFSTKNLTDFTATLNKEMYLFALNQKDNASFKWNGRFYEVIITEGLEIAMHLIPAIDDTMVPCMYDLVSQKPFYNSGDGTFLTNKSHEWNYPPFNNNYNLPSGFKKCVYLQSDGTQWIDTGVIPDNETGLYFKALQLSYGNFVPFGVSEGNNTIYPPRFSNKDLYYRWSGTAVKMMTWDKSGDLIFHSSLNLYNSKIAKFDSEDTDVVTNITSQTVTYTIPIRLFSYNLNGSYSATYGKWLGRIYRAQITQGDALIHDYVPCLDADNRPCMYDIIGGGTVEDNTYYNQSGGAEFAYCIEHQLPTDFIKLKYLESTGTQFIKTGIVPTNTTGLYIDTQDVGSGDTVPMGSWNSTSTNTRFFITRQTSSKSAIYGWGNYNQVSSTTGSVRYDSTLNWLNDRKSITNNPLFSTVITNLAELSFTPQYDIWMFGVNHAEKHAYKFAGRIYRAKISEGSEIVRDFVPAYDDLKQKPCMYDLINNIAYYNDGEGEFLTDGDFEGTYEGFGTFATIGNKLGFYPKENTEE